MGDNFGEYVAISTFLNVDGEVNDVYVGRHIYKRRKGETDIKLFGRFIREGLNKKGIRTIFVQGKGLVLSGYFDNFDFFIKIPFLSKAPTPPLALTMNDIDPGNPYNIKNKQTGVQLNNLVITHLEDGLIHTSSAIAFDPFCWWIFKP